MRTDIDDFPLFLCIVAAGGLSAAARRLRSSAPVLCRRLAAMEARFGVRLIERTSRSFRLTEEGALLRERARRIVVAVNKVEAELRTKGKMRSGTQPTER